MRSLLLVVIAAFGIAVLTTGCGSSSSAPVPKEGAKPGTEGPLDSGVKGVKGRVPKGPAQ